MSVSSDAFSLDVTHLFAFENSVFSVSLVSATNGFTPLNSLQKTAERI
jgi:hypothetical protein